MTTIYNHQGMGRMNMGLQHDYCDPFYTHGIKYQSNVAFPNVYKSTNLNSQSAYVSLQQPRGLYTFPQYRQTTGQALPYPDRPIGKVDTYDDMERKMRKKIKKKLKKKQKKYEIKI